MIDGGKGPNFIHARKKVVGHIHLPYAYALAKFWSAIVESEREIFRSVLNFLISPTTTK